MSLELILNAVGLLFNIIGSIILALSLSKFLSALHSAVSAHDLALTKTYMPGTQIIFTGLDKIIKKGSKSGSARTAIGLIILIIGFILQFVSIVITIPKK